MIFDQKVGEIDFRIGSLSVDAPSVLAPLSGVTDAVFRRIVRRLGAGLVVSEMVASDELVKGSAEAWLRAEGSGIEPHVVQLAGCEPHWMAEAAKVAESSGARIIDINMGCPAKRVIGGYAGSALMRDLDHASRLIDATVSAVCVPVTVKMRLGWDDATLNAADLARRAESLGVQAVTVHGRTRQQFYKGSANWAAIGAVSASVAIPVIANGDVATLADARRCLTESAAAAVMIGRAAIGQPWLVAQVGAGLRGRPIQTPEPEERASLAVEHYEGLLSLYGIETGIRHARKHLAAYAEVALSDGFDVTPDMRRSIVTSENPAVVTALLRALYKDRARAAA
ncbi:tRNA dihydrouridine synthase DusB [Microvirga pudoricolor]|uniref:tRNA dihydrouridine synthase DusB n=1 Tax=Microvirga pudoricolor TaxID=2778729 RepID=UPI00194F6365|nr:tRNA dihydrouridine synthase DusB [Microvirga pudoricolor]MBM6595722.1 tRNA dihydrouridine synthase DusB [Microvirga pudoricolor]